MAIDDSEVFHKPSKKRVYSFNLLTRLKALHPEKPVDLVGGQFMKDSLAPTRSGRASERWPRAPRGSVEDRDRTGRMSGNPRIRISGFESAAL